MISLFPFHTSLFQPPLLVAERHALLRFLGSVIRYFRITTADGKTYDIQHYNLAAIIVVGYKVNSERAVQFRKWATGIIESFTNKSFAMDGANSFGEVVLVGRLRGAIRRSAGAGPVIPVAALATGNRFLQARFEKSIP